MKTVELNLEHVVDDPDQPRKTMDPDELKRLALNIQHFTQLVPVIVYIVGNRYMLVDGHRRVTALRMLKRSSVWAMVLGERPDDATLQMTQLAANCMRVDLKPTEKALAFQRLKETRGWNNVQLAEAMHVSKSTVTQVLSYLTLTDEAKVMLDEGKLPESTAYAIARTEDPEKQAKMLHKASRGQLKRDDAIRDSQGGRKTKSNRSRASFRLSNAVIAVTTTEPLSPADYVAIWQQLVRECRRADKEGLDTDTFQRVLANRQAKQTQERDGETVSSKNVSQVAGVMT